MDTESAPTKQYLYRIITRVMHELRRSSIFYWAVIEIARLRRAAPGIHLYFLHR